MRYKALLLVSVGVVILFMPKLAHADYSYFTMPLAPSSYATTTGWFDHTSPTYTGDTGSTFTKYTGEQWTSGITPPGCPNYKCYNGHNGIDLYTATELKPVLAAAAGVIEENGWDDLDHHKDYGYNVRLWHDSYGLSTFYGHLAPTTTISLIAAIPVVNGVQSVSRGDHIADSGNTGNSSGPHLHFSVFNAHSHVSAYSVDPYGFVGDDPWTNDDGYGYLWTTDPPSLDATVSITSDITSNTTWHTRNTYLVSGSISVASGVTLTIEPGTVVKFTPYTSKLIVNGTLNAEGTSDKRIAFTSSRDDTVGAPTNGDGQQAAAGAWDTIKLAAGSNGTISYADIRYGGVSMCCTYYGANVYNNGGSLYLSHASVATSTSRGIYQDGGTSSISSSDISGVTGGDGVLVTGGTANLSNNTIHNNAYYGIDAWGAPSVDLASNTFYANSYGAGNLDLGSGMTFTHAGNSGSGVGSGFFVAGYIPTDMTWPADDLPYIIDSSVTVTASTTLTIDPGTIVKFTRYSSSLNVIGTLNAQGTTSTKIYFTSYKDDVGNDANGDGTATSPAPGNWNTIHVAAGGGAVLVNSIIRYGGTSMCCSYSGAEIYNTYGTLVVSNSEVASSTSYGILQDAGSTSLSGSEIHGQYHGVRIGDGTAYLSGNSIHGNLYYGLQNLTTTTIDARNNYWGAADGPKPTGSGDTVSTYVDYTPYMTSWP